MRNRFYKIFLLSLLPSCLLAQKDSLSVRSVNGLQEQQLYGIYKQQAGGMLVNPVPYFATAGIYFSSTSGDYRRAQQPGKSTVAGFSSEGLKKVDNFWVQGNFTYEREWDKDIRYSLRRNPDTRSPYYLWTPRNGDMNHESYHLDGQFATTLASDKIIAGAGASYDASDDYRTIDPRPYINYFDFNAKATIGYRFINSSYFIIEPLVGYSKESSGAYSKNNDSVNAAAYQVYRAEGLAEVSSASESRRQLSQWMNYTGISFGYYLNTPSAGNWFVKYAYKDTREKNFNRFYNPTIELVYAEVGYFDHETVLSWHKKYQKRLVTLTYTAHLTKARDYNYYLSGTNYTDWDNSNQFSFGYSTYNKQRPVHEWLLSYTRHNREQKDGNNSAVANYKNNRYAASYRVNLYGNTSQFQLTLKGAVQQNSNSSLVMPASSFDYLMVPSVLYPDAIYYTTGNWQTGITIAYNNLSVKKLRWGIELGSLYTRNSKNGLMYAQSYFQPGKDRVNWDLRLHFYL